MTIRWITDYLGTSPWSDELARGETRVVDVRLLRDAAGNSPTLIQAKIDEAVGYIRQGKPVVICCDYGISRSNAIAAAVLAVDTDISFSISLLRVIKATGETGIKIDLIEDLRRALDVGRTSTSGDGVLLLGAHGFIGRAIYSLGSQNLTRVTAEQEQALVENPVLLDATMDELRCTRILFCWRPPGLDTNSAAGQLITSLRNVLEVCRVRNAGLIFMSGHQVFAGYEGEGQASFSETDTPRPAGAAGDGLFLAETLVKNYSARHNLPFLLVRPTHVYGLGDERPTMLNTLIRKALAQHEITTHLFQNGSPYVDFIHVSDLSRAMKLAIDKKLTGMLHVASGNLISTEKLAELIVSMTNSNSRLSNLKMPGTYSSFSLDSSVANTILGWRPTVDIETGLRELIARNI